MPIFRAKALAFIPLLFLTTLFWKPALFDGKTIVHGDSVVLGLSCLFLQANSLHHLGQLLWADGVYGGHPLFAEGQGAFANPLNIVLAWIVAPLRGVIAAMNIGHWLLMIVAGIGTMGLCGSLGASRAASAFAAIAVVFSPIWIGANQNMTIYGALAWVPWAFWALEEWLKRPSPRQATLLGAGVALIILSGYPQAFHGGVIYMALTLSTMPFDAEMRRRWVTEWRARVGSGVLAMLVAAGLSAVQWLPLLELAGLSHRSGGIGLYFQLPFLGYLRGLVFTWLRYPGGPDYSPGVGSLLVMVLASLSLVIPTASRIKGHMLAALVLIQLGWGEASQFFRLLYDHNLLPGLHYFRTVHLYINIAVIGLAVLAAFAADGMRRLPALMSALRLDRSRSDLIRFALGVVVIFLWTVVAVIAAAPIQDLPRTNFAATLCAVVAGAGLVLVGRARLLPALMLVLLVGECMNLRAHSFHFYDAGLLAEPTSASAINAAAGWHDDKSINASTTGAYGFVDSHNPELPGQTRRMLEANSAMTNMMWGIRSMNAALALPMPREVMAEKRLYEELAGKSINPAGSRLMDLLAVRFISLDQPLGTAGFKSFWSDPGLGISIMENDAARSRFQLYANHLTVRSPDEALAVIYAMKTPVLVIENPPDRVQPEQTDDPAADGNPPGHFDILKAKSTEYRVDVVADRPAWFFIADANYPGWSARLDGKRVPLFSAQLLGKAVAVPQGRHRLEVTFTSSTFIVGLSISAFTLLSVVLAPWAFRRRWTGLA